MLHSLFSQWRLVDSWTSLSSVSFLQQTLRSQFSPNSPVPDGLLMKRSKVIVILQSSRDKNACTRSVDSAKSLLSVTLGPLFRCTSKLAWVTWLGLTFQQLCSVPFIPCTYQGRRSMTTWSRWRSLSRRFFFLDNAALVVTTVAVMKIC